MVDHVVGRARSIPGPVVNPRHRIVDDLNALSREIVDDVDEVTASDEAPDGRRRAPLEEVRRGIEAAGFSPVEGDGRFQVIA